MKLNNYIGLGNLSRIKENESDTKTTMFFVNSVKPNFPVKWRASITAFLITAKNVEYREDGFINYSKEDEISRDILYFELSDIIGYRIDKEMAEKLVRAKMLLTSNPSSISSKSPKLRVFRRNSQ